MSIVTNNDPHTKDVAEDDGASQPKLASAPLPAPRVHLAYLDGLRALAALYVVLHHASRYAFDNLAPDRMTPIQKQLAFVFLGGSLAVVLFIVLSGFCLMLPVVRGDGTLRGGALHFLGKRVRRILPPYYFAIGLSLLLICLLIGTRTGTVWDECTDITVSTLVTHLLLIQNLSVSTASGINYPLWTVAIEWQIYFLFPLLVWGWGRLGPILTVAMTLGLSVIANEDLKNTPFLGANPVFLGAFALGMLGAGIAYGDHALLTAWRQRVPWLWLTLALALAFYLPMMILRKVPLGATPAEVVFAMLSVSLIILASRPGANPLNRVLSWKPLVTVGVFSYSLYLIHAPVLQLIWQYGLLARHLEPVPLFLVLAFIGVPLIVAASYVFSLGCERPFLSPHAKKVAKQVEA